MQDSQEYAQACAVLYRSAPTLRPEPVQEALRQFGARSASVAFDTRAIAEGRPLIQGRAQVDGHELRLIAVAEPADDPATRFAIEHALLADDDRAALLAHRAYIHCLYASGSDVPLAQLRALYRLAGALVRAGAAPAAPPVSGQALGLVDVPGIQAFSAPALLDMLRWLDASPPPISLWVRLVEVGARHGPWLLTRGMAHLRLPELGVNARDTASAESAEALLMSVAHWMVSGATKAKAGDVLDMMAEEGGDATRASMKWRLLAPNRDGAWLNGPYGTLVLTPAR